MVVHEKNKQVYHEDLLVTEQQQVHLQHPRPRAACQ
jgi:hypothetical protein